MGTPTPDGDLITADKRQAELQSIAEYERLKRDGKRLADEQDKQLRKLTSIRADTITPRRVRWLWAPGQARHGRIPMGELTLIVGRGGVGKSTLLAQLAAWITVGDMEGEYKGTPRDVLYVANEDSLTYTVVPRLLAAGADMSRIRFLGVQDTGEEGTVLLPVDCARIEAEAARVGAVAIMLDPLSSNLHVDNGNDAKKMRGAIEAIRRMCEKSNIAAIGLAHTRKAQSANLMDALMGSSELGNVCRSAMGVMADPEKEDAIILSQEKSNLGKLNIDSYLYRIVSHTFMHGDELINAGQLNFLGKSDQKVSDILADQMNGIDGSDEVATWLRDYLLCNGQTPRSDVMIAARKEGYTEKPLRRARERIKVEAVRTGFPSHTEWKLPTESKQGPVVPQSDGQGHGA